VVLMFGVVSRSTLELYISFCNRATGVRHRDGASAHAVRSQPAYPADARNASHGSVKAVCNAYTSPCHMLA
jgi:hypothetical protein